MTKDQVLKNIEMLLKFEFSDAKTATIIGPGRKWNYNSLPVEIVQIIDYDPYHPAENYECKDAIFDNINIKGDIIITLSGEKMYPPTRKYLHSPHIMVIDTQPHNGNCTLPDMLDHEDKYFEREDLGPFIVYSGQKD